MGTRVLLKDGPDAGLFERIDGPEVSGVFFGVLP